MKKYLLLDLDGTITDSAEGIIRSVAYAPEHLLSACRQAGRQVVLATAKPQEYAEQIYDRRPEA